MSHKTCVTVWGENRHEKTNPAVTAVYPDGMHQTIAYFLRATGEFTVQTATLDQPENGLSRPVLAASDVLIWWGHLAHEEVDDAIAERIKSRVFEGMGLIVLHSGHHSKIFKSLMGTSCSLKWREANDTERIWNILPSHPIASGVGESFDLAQEEMYGEPFEVPPPDELIFISWFSGGEVFRSGCTWRRGRGRVFFFRPGHETFPTYKHQVAQRVIINAVKWAAQNPLSTTADS